MKKLSFSLIAPLAMGSCLVLSSLSAFAAGPAVPPPTLENKAYVLMDYDSGRILAQVNAEMPLPPASMTKMMTSYIIEQSLKSGRLKQTDQVHVSQNAWCRGTSEESCMYLPLNGTASVIDMLRGIIIQSGNDASKAMAEHIAGTEPAFAELMNKEAQRLGMTQSHFMNATGLPDPQHKASSRDLAILARAIIHDSTEYYPIYAEKEFKFNNIKQGNRNALLYTDPTVDGLKTGHTSEAGFCLTASAKRDGMRLISVVMGANSMQARADQTRALFAWGFGQFERAVPARTGAPLGQAPVRFGKEDLVPAVLQQDFSLLVPRGQAQQVKTSVQYTPGLTAPIQQGAVVGKIVATIDGQTYAEQPLVAQQAVEEAGFFKRLWQRILSWFGK
ncbi:D-alanyl-D-alanine carboxypeptidase family protein [Aquabacterium sp.]|uniref:D-alanyl-D-alanine carboxypeptidase family protein n=1 Tax=Aquabacterium sp. TaxID=1872578 RepID=UPI0035B0BDCC